MSSSLTVDEALVLFAKFFIVALVWGGTNPFLRRGGEAAAKDTGKPKGNGIGATLNQFLRTLANWRFSVPFGINQLGSQLYNILLGSTKLSMAVPIVNSMTLVVTGVVARLLGEKEPVTAKSLLGAVLVVAGVSMCVAGEVDDFVGTALSGLLKTA